MQTETSSRIYDKCRCCMVEGQQNHNFGDVHRDMLRKYLNLIVTHDSRISLVICAACLRFLCDVQRFRKMVMSSQKQLLSAVGNADGTMFMDVVFEECSLDDSNIINEDKVKEEVETTYDVDPNICSGNVSADVPDHVEDGKLKTELKTFPEYLSDWETLEDIECNVKTKIVGLKTSKGRRENKYGGKIKPKKKRKKYGSESDTPISEIKDKKTRLKNKIEKEPKTSTSASTESRKHSFLDNNKVRSNIILILKHSTILPFRNNFKSTFKCFYCEKLYIPFKELKDHIEAEHSHVSETTIGNIVRSLQNLIVTADISCVKCRICDVEFKSIENLVEHLCNAHGKIYQETDRKPSHGILGVDLSSDTLKCHICNKEFAFFKNLSVHMNEHYGSFVCYVCGKKFLSEHRYKCHVFKAHADKETKCKHCGKIFSTEPAMAYHVRKEHLKRMIKCLKCPETFSLGQYVKRLNHMAQVHGIKKPVFRCDTCGREYANSGSLAAHKRYTHKRTKEHKCEICGYITVHNTVMKKHMDVHNGVKNYECEFCKKKFAKPYTLKLHMKIHLNDKRFACTLCDSAFIQKNSLKSHLKSRHPESCIDINKL